MDQSAKDAWSQVGDRFASWGRGVASRYREAGSDTGESAEETQRSLEKAARDLKDELGRGFTAMSATFRDDQAKKDLQDAVSAIGDAITATVEEASKALRRGASGSEKPDPE